MELRLHADRAGLHEKTRWVTLNWALRPIHFGHGIDMAPRAPSVTVVVPDDCLSVITLDVPDLPRQRLVLALPGLLEDHILVPPESAGFALLETPKPGKATVAVYYKAWFDAMLATPQVASAGSVRVVAESWAMPRRRDMLAVHFSAERYLLALPGWAACTGDNNPEGDPPQHLVIALRELVEQSRASVKEASADADNADFEKPALAIYCAADLGERMPDWVLDLGFKIEAGGVMDWVNASYDAAPDLTGRQGVALPATRIMRALKPALAMMTVIVAMEFLLAGADWLALMLERRQLLARQEQIFRATFGQQAPMVNAQSQMLRKLETVQRASGESAATDFLALMTQLAQDVGSPQPLDEIRYDSGQLMLRVRSKEDEAVWMNAARSAGLTATREEREGARLIRVAR